MDQFLLWEKTCDREVTDYGIKQDEATVSEELERADLLSRPN